MNVWFSTLWDMGVSPVQWGVVIGASLLGAFFDVRSGKIPNRMTGVLFLAGLIWAAIIGGLSGLADSIIGCLLMATPYVLLFALANGGAGDAKLMGALGAWLGVINGFVTLLSVAIVGGVVAVVIALVHRRFRELVQRIAMISTILPLRMAGASSKCANPGELFEGQSTLSMPYGVAILLGVLAAAGGVHIW